MTVERLHNRAWQISDVIDGHRVHQTYYFYTRREAVALFKGEYK